VHDATVAVTGTDDSPYVTFKAAVMDALRGAHLG
jgi:hypothetical protein